MTFSVNSCNGLERFIGGYDTYAKWIGMVLNQWVWNGIIKVRDQRIKSYPGRDRTREVFPAFFFSVKG